MDEDFKPQALNSTLQSPADTLLSIRLLDFKTSLLEAIEELRLRRVFQKIIFPHLMNLTCLKDVYHYMQNSHIDDVLDCITRETENNYEDQISKIVVEKQELEWQKILVLYQRTTALTWESLKTNTNLLEKVPVLEQALFLKSEEIRLLEALQHQMDTLHQQSKEALAAFKKQLQTRMFAVEEEKGKYQLAVETKEKEIDGLKETLKALQISKYTLQKKLSDMDQKLQMHLTAKEEHQKKLNEVEKCYATIACQFGIIKGVHGKLEHSVQEAIQLNKKLTSVNKRQETEISNLKEELKKVTTDLIRSKVTSQYRVGEENINLATKEKQFQELQQKIRMETAVIKKVQEENTHIKEENLEILSSLQCVQELLQRVTQTNVRMESELNAMKEEYQTLERDNELQREKAKENEEKFLNLQNEHEKALRTWKKDEENMRREIDILKSELNSLKGVHRHLEDYPPQENQHSEQVQNLHSGQEHSKDNEIQAIQKENECIIIKDDNFGHEETEVKSTMDSSSIEKLQIEQNLQVLENSFKDEINVANPYGEKQREASPRNTLCTDTDLITQGQISELHVTECKEAEKLEATHGILLDENNANLEQKLQESTEPLAAGHTQTKKVLLDSADTAGAYWKSTNQEMNSRKPELCNTTDGSSSTWADKKLNTVQHNKSLLTPEAAKADYEAVLCTEKNAECETSTNNHQAKELSFGILSHINDNSPTEYQQCSVLDNDNYLGNGLHKTEENLLNLSGLPREKLPFKKMPVHAEDRNDDARNTNRHNALRNTALPATDAQDLLGIPCDNASSSDATREHSSTMSLFSLAPTKIERGINVDDMSSKQPEEAGNATNTSASITEAVSPVKADGLEIIAYKETPTDSTNKVSPCKKVNDDIQIHSIKKSHSLEINNSASNTLLKEKKDLLNSIVPGRKFAEGHLKELCSLPMRTSGNLVNTSGRSSFDLSTTDKKAEKNPVYLNFLDLSSCSRVNQMRGQATCTSASKEPSLMKEKLPCLVENTKITSRTQCQNLSESVDRREKGLGSTSFNRAADTLNTSSIPRDPQGDPSEGWNAIAKTFYDSSFPTEHVKEGFTVLQHQQNSSHVTVTPSRSESALRDEDSSSTHNSIIQNQIEEIEKILNLERLHSSRKRKYEEGQ